MDLDPGPLTPPRRFFHVAWWEARSEERPNDRERTSRNFTSASAAARQLAYIARWPRHHVLIGVAVTDTDWQQINPDQLPEPE